MVNHQSVEEEEMKSIAELYLAYLEKALISMVLASLVFISVSGIVNGGIGLLSAVLSIVTLGLIVTIEIDRRRAANIHPEFKTRPFGETRLFWVLFEEKVFRIAKSLHFGSREPQRYLIRIAAILILALSMGATWSFVYADIQRKNQAIIQVEPGVPATAIVKAAKIGFVIEVVQISAQASGHKVTALIHPVGNPDGAGNPDTKIESEGVGYETTYSVVSQQFIIRIIKISDSSATFLLERATN